MWRQIVRFGLVGAMATLVHLAIGYILIRSGWQAVTANGVAFAIAFMVSFVGHLGFSFADQEASVSSALWKFAIVGLAGFSCNEAALVGLLATDAMADTTALFISTSCAAVLTFVLSRFWAFSGSTVWTRFS